MKVRQRSYPYVLSPGDAHPDKGRTTPHGAHTPRMQPRVARGQGRRETLYNHAGHTEFTGQPLPSVESVQLEVAVNAVEAVRSAGLEVTVPAKGKKGTPQARIPEELMPRSAGTAQFPGRRLLRALRGYSLTATATAILTV